VNLNGTNTLTTKDPQGNIVVYAAVPSYDGTIDTYQGPNGSTATVISMKGNEAILLKDSNGNETIFSSEKVASSNTSSVIPNVTPTTISSTIIPPSSNFYSNTNMENVKTKVKTNHTPMTSYTPPNYGPGSNRSSCQGNSPSLYPSTSYVSGPSYDETNQFVNNTRAAYDYSSSLPTGISRSQIPPGQEDKYILKSEVVPPVCPVCPVQTTHKKCPPCPACQRCPEPSYNCKLVPNYASMNVNAPVPVLNDFSTFGM